VEESGNGILGRWTRVVKLKLMRMYDTGSEMRSGTAKMMLMGEKRGVILEITASPTVIHASCDKW